jgi:hypothetical protein
MDGCGFLGPSLLMAAGLVSEVLQLERHNALADRCNPCIYLVLSLAVVARMMMWHMSVCVRQLRKRGVLVPTAKRGPPASTF